MARSGGATTCRARKTRPPLERYNRLNPQDQLICCFHWRFIVTKGTEGWDTDKAGFKQHWRHFPAIANKYTPSAFYSVGKTLVGLAKEISSQGYHLKEPDLSGAKFDDNNLGVEEEDDDEEELSNVEEDIFDKFHITMPAQTKKQSPARIKASDFAERVANEVDQTLPHQMVFGSFKTFNFTTRKRQTNVVFRLLVHSFITICDIEFTWVHPRKLKIRVAWPDWWVNPEQQAEFDVDESAGAPSYPITHQLIGEIMENNESRREDDGRVWDEGYFVFDQNMSTDPMDTDIWLKPLLVSSLDQAGKFISVKAEGHAVNESCKTWYRRCWSGIEKHQNSFTGQHGHRRWNGGRHGHGG